ncbi:MAG: hypothetical protein V4567_05310 [Pseudomonadota bacterium]
MTRLIMGEAEVDLTATKSLRGLELKAKNRGDTSSAMLSAGYYARKMGHTMYGYAGNSYGSAVWRVTDKPSEYLSPINNTGKFMFSVTPDLTVARHEMRHPDDDLEPNASSGKATAADAARWIAFESDDYDALGGSEGYGWARATTDDVAAGIGVSTEEAYRLLKAAQKKDLVYQDKERRKSVNTKRFGTSQVGWAIWEVHLTREQARAHHSEEEFQRLYEANGFEPNASSKLEWIKSSGVDRDGHSLTWWKNKVAKWKGSRHDMPTVVIQIMCWDRAGGSTGQWPEFAPDELKEAKAWAKEFIEQTGGSCRIDGRVTIPYQSTVTIELGEWKNNASNGFYVWSVDAKTFVPVSRKGPFEHPDEAIGVAKLAARGGSTYDEVVTFGGDPEAPDFSIEKSFKAWSGEVHYSSDLPRVGGRLREYR